MLNLAGMRFGRLVAIHHAPKIDKYKRWHCVCDCGSNINVTTNCLTSGSTRSCGCIKAEGTHYIHGHAKKGKVSAEYKIYRGIVGRCMDKGNSRYEFYGGRGISICDRWRFGETGLSGFQCFLLDMGPRPPHLTIDRIDGTKNYGPTNCRWATIRQQQRNRRSNRKVVAWGKEMILIEALEIANLSRSGFMRRIQDGLTETEALEKPVRRRGARALSSATVS